MLLTSLVARIARIGVIVLAAAVMITALCSDAAAKHRKGRLRHRGFTIESRERQSGKNARFVSQEPVRLRPMRYYGGPKSPMWRGPAEN
jgi:hypothetical protein